MKQLESESRELKEELNSYQFEYDELWKKLEDVQEENKLLSRDIEWLNRESSMKDKLLSEKVDMINNLLQKVSTTSIPLDNSDKSATVNQSNQSIPNVPDSRNHHIIHLIGDSLIRPVIPELLFPSDFKAEIKRTQCFVFDEVNNFTPDPQAKIVVVHCGTNDIANCSNINDVLTLAQNSLLLLKEKLPSSAIMMYSMVAPRGDSADLLVKEFNAHMLLFCNKHHILLCDHNNLVQRDGIISRFFSQDKVHLSEEGNKVFSTNLSYAIRTALKIPVIPKRKRSKTPHAELIGVREDITEEEVAIEASITITMVLTKAHSDQFIYFNCGKPFSKAIWQTVTMLFLFSSVLKGRTKYVYIPKLSHLRLKFP